MPIITGERDFSAGLSEQIANDENSPDFTDKGYSERIEKVNLMRDSFEGEDAIKAAGEKYLPRPSAMDMDEYEDYKDRGDYPEVVDVICRQIIARLLRKPAEVEGPDDFLELIDNMDSAGFSSDQMLAEIAKDYTLTEYVPIRVDVNGRQPRVIRYMTEHFYGSMHDENGRLTFSNLDEAPDQPNPFDDEITTRRRTLALQEGQYVSRVWRRSSREIFHETTGKPTGEFEEYWEKESETVPTNGTESFTAIPFLIVGGFADMHPTLLKVARSAKKYYRVATDLQHSLYLGAHEQPYIVWGEKAEEFLDGKDAYGRANRGEVNAIAFGSSVCLQLPHGSEAGFMSPTGSGRADMQAELERQRKVMVSQGAHIMQDALTGQVARETFMMKRDDEAATLGGISEVLTRDVTTVYKMAAEFVGMDSDEVSVKYTGDFFEKDFTPAELKSMVDSWVKGAIGWRELYDWKRDRGLELQDAEGRPLSPEEAREEIDREIQNRIGADLDFDDGQFEEKNAEAE